MKNRTKQQGFGLSTLILLAIISIFSQNVTAQTPAISPPVANQADFPGTQICVDIPMVNSGPPGYGPYLQLIVPAGLTFNSASLFGSAIAPINEGIFPAAPGNQLNDSIINQPVTGPEGDTLLLLQPPIGSVVTGGPALPINLCYTIDASSPVNTPLTISATPVYQFGDTPTGDNGPIIGTANTFDTTPILVLFRKEDSAPEDERPPGPSWPVTYTLTADVASNNTINNVVIIDTLPTNFVLTSSSVVPNTCSITTGANLTVNCPAITGTNANDVVVTYTGYYSDVLDETNCSTSSAINTATFDADFGGSPIPQLSASRTNQIEHISLQKGASPFENLAPGDVVTFTLSLQITDYGTASSIQLQDILPDGYTFNAGSETASFGAITATVSNNTPSNGATTLDFDVTAANGGDFAPGTAITISYQTTIDALYFNGNPLLASDDLTNTITNTYGLSAGAAACTDNSSATVSIEPVTVQKEVVSTGPYYPGDTVIYRLTLNVPSGDTNNVVFTDFFPLPVLFATTLNTNTNLGINPDISLSPTDTLGLTPTSITTDAATNSLVINWPNISTATPQVLSVEVSIDVTTEPFDDDLSLSNLLQVSTENTGTVTATAVAPVLIAVKSPKAKITKGVAATNGNGTINPLPTILPIDGNLTDADGSDTVTYVVTIENIRARPIYDVTLTDPAVVGLNACSIDSVLDGLSNVLATTGSLATGLVLTNPLPANVGATGAPYNVDTALITYTCTMDAAVPANSLLTNEATVTYAAVSGGTIIRQPKDDATVQTTAASLVKTILSTSPNADGDNSTVTIGETIQYQVLMTIPEGTLPNSSLVDTLDAGLVFQSFDAIIPSNAADISTSHGTFAGVLTDATGIGTNTATFPFDTIANANSDNAVTETITVIYTVLVQDIPANSNGGIRNNSANLSYTTGSVSANAPNVTIQEPNLTINKTVSPTTADAGDTVSYTIVVTNTGPTTAYTTTVSDPLTSSFLNLQVGTVTTTQGSVTTGNTGGDTTVAVNIGDIAAAGVVTITFDVTLDASTPSGATIVNTAAIDGYNSLPAGAGRPYGPTADTATVTGVAAIVTKSTLPATSTEQSIGNTSAQGNGSLVDLTIGEEVTFEITTTLAEGVSPSVIITDTLPNNATGHMDVTGFSIVSIGANLTPTNAAPTDSNPATNILALDFGSVTNVADGVVTAADQIVIQVTAIVVDAVVNSGLEVLTNNVMVQYNTGLTASSSSDVEVVEPRMTVNKTGSTTTADAGDTITFTITIDNLAANNSQANAFDIDLSDIIPADYTYVPASLTQVSGPAADAGTLIENAGTIQGHWTQFDLGQSAVISYQVTVDNTVAPQQVVTNTANLAWTSMPGTPAIERTGTVAEGHSVTMTAPGVDKTVFATSEASSGNLINGTEPDILIGETVTYRFTITIPEGTSSAATAFDQLPTTSTIMNVVSSQIIAIGGQLSFTPATVSVGQAGIASDSDADTYNDLVVWNLGDIFNMPDGLNNAGDQITFEVVAMLVDEAVNQNGGNDIVNTATFTTGGNASSGTALIDIIEPVISVTKQTVPGSITADAGDILDYRITITHAPNSRADAFNFTVTDVLPTPGTNWINNATVTSNCGVVTTDSSNAPTIEFTFSELTIATGVCEINYQVSVDVGVNPNETYQNTVTTTYTSTSVINAETRTGTVMDSTSFITPDPAIIKVSASSSNSDTGTGVQNGLLPDLAIGETIDFTLTVIFPEGTTTNAVVVDSLPVALSGGMLEAISATVDSIGANLTSSLPGTPILSDADGDINSINDTITFDFGTVVNTPDGAVTAEDNIVITVTARVVDDAVNVNLDTLINSASFSYDTGSTLIDTAQVEIVEPVLALTKTMGPMVDHVVPITLTFANTGDAPAYDVSITDILDTSIWDVASISAVATPAGYTFASNAGPGANQQTVSYTTSTQSIAAGATQVFTFNVTLRDDAVLPTSLPNTATVTEVSSMPGADPSERDLSDITANASLPIPLLDSTKSAALQIDADGSGDNSPSDTLRYTITITNSGTGAATGVVLTDAPDANVSLVIGSATTTIGSVTTGNTAGDTLIAVNIGTIPANSAVTVTYDVTINNPLASGVTQLTNQGLIESNETPDFITDDPSTGTIDDPTIVPVNARPDLVVVKDDGGTSTTAGGTVVYTIGYNNIGSQDAVNIVITETVPANSSFDAANSTGVWNCMPNILAGSVCTQNIAAVNAGAPIATTDFAVTVDTPLADGVTQLSNSVSITDDGSNGADLDNSNNTGTDTTPINATPDMQILKSDGNATTFPTGTVIYTLDYSNIGGQDATGVVITETVPANSSFNAGSSTAGWNCVPDNSAGSTCTLNIGNVAGNGGNGSVLFAVTVDSPLNAGVSDLSNTASIADDGNNGVDPDTNNNTSTDTTPINATPDLSIVKTDNNVVAAPGDTLVYDLIYDNIGNQNATGAIISETVPANTTFNAGASSAGWSCAGGGVAGSACTFAIGNLAVGAGATIQFAVDIDNPLASGVLAILNSASISDDGNNGTDSDLNNNTSGATTSLGSALPDLEISKDDGGVSVNAGDTITYVINYANIGNQASDLIVITETVPANTSFNAGSSTAGWVCTPNNNAGSSCTYAVGTLNGGGTGGSINFAVDVDNPLAAAVDTINNVISIADDGTNGPDANPNNNNDNDNTPVAAVPDLSITKTDQSNTVVPGGTVVYDINYQNIGSQDATGVVITETVPANTTFNTPSSSAGWTCLPNGNAGNTCTFNVGNLMVTSGVQTIQFAVDVYPTVPEGITTISNTISIVDDGNNGIDSNPNNNSDPEITDLIAAPDLSVRKSDHDAHGVPGNIVIYDIEYINYGNQNATNVIITETVPLNSTFIPGSSSAGWTCLPNNNAGSTCTVQIPVLLGIQGFSPPPSPWVISFAVRVDDPLASGVIIIENTVSIDDDGTNGTDTNLSNNTGHDNTPLNAALPDLVVTKTDNNVTVAPGDTLLYVVNYSNIGNQNSTGVVITETVPTYTTFNPTASSAGWSCTPNNNTGSSCTFNVGNLNGGGANGSINFAVNVQNTPLPTGIDSIGNSISIADDGTNGLDSNPNNNNDTESTPLNAAPNFSISKVDQQSVVAAGGLIIYDITYENHGNQDATGVVITETVPAHTTFNNASSSTGWICTPNGNAGNTCTFTVGALSVAAGSTTIQFAVDVDIPLPASVNSIENTVRIGDDGSNGVDPDLNDNNDPESTTVDALPDLTLDKSDGGATSGPGQTIVYTLSYANIGNQGATGVIITETVPANSSFNQTASSGTWICTPNNLAGSSCQYNVGSLIAGASGSVSFAIDVDNPLPQGVNLITNTAIISDDGSNGVDSNPSNNTGTDSTSLQLNPPVGVKIGSFDANDNRLIHWTFWWFNPNNDNRDLPVFVFDNIPAGTSYVAGSASCSATGTSSCTLPSYNSVLNRLELNAVLGPDAGAPANAQPSALNNEILIQFDTRVTASGNVSISNQAHANWDYDNDGNPLNDADNGQTPIPTDDPATNAPNDPTGLQTAFPIPVLSIWTLLALVFSLFGISILTMRLRQ